MTFPPRCCGWDIELGPVRIWLDEDIIYDFLKKKVEYETLNKTYCSGRTCSEFILPENIVDDVGTCPYCLATTCTLCKQVAHPEAPENCPKDTAVEQVLELADTHGWQRCYSCSTMVEHIEGCGHMHCICDAEFCYYCARLVSSK